MTAKPRYRWLIFPAVVAILGALAWPGLATVARGAQATPEADGGAVAPLATAGIVPADAPLYVAATLDPDSEQWRLAEELIRRAGLGDLLDQAVEEAVAEDEGELDVFLNGEVAFVVADLDLLTAAADVGAARPRTATPEEPAPVGFAVVIASRDPDAVETFARESTAEEAALRGVEVEEIEEDGATITVAPGDEFEDGTAFVRLDDLLVVSATPADLAPFIEVSAENAPSLAEADPFLAVRQELPNDFLAYGYTNGPAIREGLEEVLAAMADPRVGLAQMAGLEQTLAGLDAYSGFTLWADDPGFRVDTIAIPIPGATLPPVPANFDATLPERVPGDTVLFVDSFDYGPTLGPTLDVIGALVLQVAAEDPTFPLQLPPGATDEARADAVYELAGRFLAFNPRTDLIEQLVGEWGLAVSVRPEDPAFVSAVLVSGVADETRLNDAITKLAVWVNLAVIGLLSDSPEGEEALFGEERFGAGTEEVDGTLTQVIEIPIPEEGITVRLQWGIVDGELVFGVGDGFGEYLAGPDASLADSPRFQAVMAELPDEHFATFYVDLGRLIELAMPLIEEELAAEEPFGATPEAGELPDLSAIQALAAVGFERDGMIGSSTILYISEQ